MIDHFEILIRSILIRPDKPAVLLFGHFSPQTHQTHGFAGPDHWHNIVAQFYGVPHVSIISALFPSLHARSQICHSSRRYSWRTSRARYVQHGAWPPGRRTKLPQCTPQGLKQVQATPMVYSAALVNARESLSQKRI